MVTPEFTRRIGLDTIGTVARPVAIKAAEAERQALARRFGIVAIEALSARAELVSVGGGIEARGRLSARVVQSCVVSGEPVPARIDEDFALRFVEPALLTPEGDEIELTDTDCDLLAIEGGAVDLGEAVAQSMALALDPFPRVDAGEGEERVWRAGEEKGAFAGLKGLLGG